MEKFVNFMKIVEEVGLDNYIFDSELYDSLSNMYRYKTYLLLHFAFKDIDLDVFKGIKIKKTIYVLLMSMIAKFQTSLFLINVES
jgi:hypothetical protein